MTNKRMTGEREGERGVDSNGCRVCVRVQSVRARAKEHQRNPGKVSCRLQLYPLCFPSCFLLPRAFVFTLPNPVQC